MQEALISFNDVEAHNIPSLFIGAFSTKIIPALRLSNLLLPVGNGAGA